MKSKIKAVVFDLGGTLIPEVTCAEITDFQERMAATLLIPSSDLIPLWNASFEERMKRLYYDCQTCLRHICQQLSVVVSDKQIELIVSMLFDGFNRLIMAPREGALEVLSSLRSEGYKVGLISNCTSEKPTVWEKTSLAPLLDAAIFSCSVGMVKPDPNIYYLAVEQLAVEPAECLYVDDNIEPLEGALGIGMTAVLIRTREDSALTSYPINQDDWGGPVISSLTEVLALLD